MHAPTVAFAFLFINVLWVNALRYGFHKPVVSARRDRVGNADCAGTASTSLLSQHVALISAWLVTTPIVSNAASLDIISGRTASLLHPITNFALFGTTLYSAYLGLQWRRLRDIGEEIRTLSNQLPSLSSGPAKSPLKETVVKIQSELKKVLEKDGSGEGSAQIKVLQSDLQKLRGAAELDNQIVTLVELRKSLLAANLKDKHHLTGSILLGVGVTVSVLGAYNTFLRTGKLFPGPHLYGGMAITILWAVAASLVPAMQKGNEAARIAHISANVVNVILFASQIPSGIEILLKVVENTSWP